MGGRKRRGRRCSIAALSHSLLILLLCITHSLSLGQQNPITTASGNLQNYIIHLREPSSVNITNLTSKDLQEWHRSFLPKVPCESDEPRIMHSYRYAISGFAAKLTPGELRIVESMDGFILARADGPTLLFTTYTPGFLALKHWGGLWPESSHGEGTIIGVIDTGVRPEHPSFGAKGMTEPPVRWRGRCDLRPPAKCNNKLIGATAFVAGLPAPSPEDGHGHGTSTASVSAGNFVRSAEGTTAGTAPRAHLAVYKACHDGHGRESDLLAAIDRAIADGVDILSLSIGQEPKPLHESSVAMGSFAAIRHGIFPCCAAGNFGPDPSILSNNAPWCLTVGAATTDRRITAVVRLGNRMEMEGESAYQPPTFDSNAMLPLVFPDGNCQKGSLGPSAVSGKIVLCVADENENLERSDVIKAAGGAAMILMNRLPNGYTTKADPHSVPASHVSNADGQKIQAYIRTTLNPSATIIFKGVQFGVRPTPAVASFSARGPSLNNGGILKPDIVAPGVNILTAWPNSSSGFNFASGTSVAASHVSGIAAMLKKLRPEWSTAAIQSAIMTTAYVRDRNGNAVVDQSGGGGKASFFAMGAGHVNPAKAAYPGLVYDLHWQDYIPYLCGLGYTNDQVRAVINDKADCSIIKGIRAEELNYPSIAMSLRPGESRSISRTVTYVAEESSIFEVRVEEPEGVSVHVDPQKLKFSSLKPKGSFTVRISAKLDRSRKGKVSEGSLVWISGCFVVRSPISIFFT